MKRSTFFSVFLLLLTGNLFSQTSFVDSLLNDARQQTNDTTRLIDFKKLSKYYVTKNIDSAIYYAEKMKTLAFHKNLPFYISDSYDLYCNIYEQTGDLEKCIVNNDSAIYYSNLINDEVGVIFFTNNKAGIYIKMGRYFEALQTFEEVKKIAEIINDPPSIVAVLNNMGVVYYYLGDDKVALDYFIKAYQLRLKNNLTKKLAYSLNNIGAIYSKYGNYTEAVEYHKKAMQTAIKQNDDYNFLVALINLGTDYDFLADYKQSLEYYNKALQEAKRQGDKTFQSHALERMSAVYIKQNNYKKAKPLLIEAYKISKENGNKYDFSSFSNSLGMIYLKEKNYPKAYDLFSEALTVAKEISASKLEVDINKSLTAYYYSVNNLKEAFRYQKIYDQKRDSLYKAETDLKIANLKSRFELNQKMKELELKDVELSTSKKISNERLQIIYLVGFAGVVLLVLIIFIFVLYKKIKYKNQIIRQSEEQVKKLLEHEKELGKLKTQLISTVSHEFRTPMAIISSNAQLLRDYDSSMDEKMRKETLQYISTGVENMVSMMQNFEVLDKNTILEFNPEETNLSDLLTTIANGLQSIPIYNNRIKTVNRLSITNAVIDKGLITHIVRNLLVNALKFSGDKTVNFTFENREHEIIIIVEDKGIGMAQEDAERIFDNFYRGSNVENIKGTGVGMSVVKRCVNLHVGKISVESKLNEGTKIRVVLPFGNN